MDFFCRTRFLQNCVASSTGASYFLANGRAGACCAYSKCGMGGLFYFFFSISTILSSFSNASSVERQLDMLKYCGRGCYNPAVVLSYCRKHAR